MYVTKRQAKIGRDKNVNENLFLFEGTVELMSTLEIGVLDRSLLGLNVRNIVTCHSGFVQLSLSATFWLVILERCEQAS